MQSPTQHVIYEAGLALANEYEQEMRGWSALHDVWDQSLFVDTGLDLIDDSLLTTNSSVENMSTEPKDDIAWDHVDASLFETDLVGDMISDAHSWDHRLIVQASFHRF